MWSDDYIYEKLSEAVYDLVVGEKDARSRVNKAYYKFWHIDEQSFPEHLRDKRGEIEHLLTRLPSHQKNIIADNLSRMKNSTASKIARLIFELHEEFEQFNRSSD